MQNVIIDGKQVDLKSVYVDDIDPKDAPDYCDAFISEASFEDGTPLTEKQMEELFGICGHDLILDQIH